MLLDDVDVRARVARLETLLEQIESLEDARARSIAAETVQALLALYGQGLARVMEHSARLGGAPLFEALATDELVSHLLLVHGLHPIDLEVRVRRALEEVRPYLESHGGSVELLGIVDGVAHLRLQGSCGGCPSSAGTLQQAIEEAILKAAPDLDRIEAEEAAEPPPRPAVSFVALSSLQGAG